MIERAGLWSYCAFCFFLWVWSGGAQAHDQWQDGSPVPAWVKAVCCGPDDIHHFTSDQIHVRGRVYEVPGYGDYETANATPSPDGDFWAFFKLFPDGTHSTMYCFFAPFGGA